MPPVIITIIYANSKHEAVIGYPSLPGYTRVEDPIFQVEQDIDYGSTAQLDELITKARDQGTAKGIKEIFGLGAKTP